MKKTSPRIGLLPFYLKLYDDLQPERHAGFDAFVHRIATGFETRGVSVQIGPVCRLEPEFKQAMAAFEGQVDAVVTLHLAYSPSLEALDAFCRSELPVILLDTTMDADFGTGVSTSRIMYNHGVHGVMDFACMLRRRGRPYEIVAGHDSDPSTLDRAAAIVHAARAAREMRGNRALRVGPAFKGMGDFAVAEKVLRQQFGMSVHEVGIETLDAAVAAVSEAAVTAELAADRERFVCEIDEAAHQRSVRVGLGLRTLLEDGDYNALSVNFQAFDGTDRPACTMPFLEISKAMARGIGYGGEGDVLTAALVGALARTFGRVTFTEIFCADWAGDTLFLSHMGEINPMVAAGKARLFAKPFFVKGVPDPALLTCKVQPGPAVFVNLTPGPNDTFSLIVAPVEVCDEGDALEPAMRNTVRIWIKPRRPVSEFLESYSRAGGTHHSALVLGDHAAAIAAFGRFSGLEVVELA